MSQLEDLQAANEELTRKWKILRNANKKEDDLRGSSPPASEEILAKAELGVAKAKLGVAEAKLGVAEAEGASPQSVAEAKLGVAEAQLGVAKAQLGVAQAKGASTDEIAEFKEEITELMRGVALKRNVYERTLPGTMGAAGGSRGGTLEIILEDVVSIQKQVVSGQERLVSGQEKLLKSFEDMTRKPKSGSDCTNSDWQKFNFQGMGTLQIPSLNPETFSTVYNKVYTSKKKDLKIKDLAQQYSFENALLRLDLKEEKKYMHPITMHFLTQCLALRPGRLRLASEVGFFSNRYCMYGFGDKAAFVSELDSPDNYRPSKANISQSYNSPVPLLGAIEEKGLRGKLESPAFAQLAAQMAGFVEAAQAVKGFHYKSFPGLLIGVVESEGKRELVGYCVLWTQARGQEFRQVSKLLETQEEFCSGVEWWFQQCEALLEAVEKVSQEHQGSLPSLVSCSDAPGTGADQGEKGSDDEDNLDEASTMLQSISFGSSPQETVCNSDLSEHAVKFIGTCGDGNRTESWVSAALARFQASKLQAGF